MEMPLFDNREYYPSAGNCAFLGFRMRQNRLAVAVLSYILESGGFARVIELGTGHGGLSALLGLQCKMQGARFVTFDLVPGAFYAPWFPLFGVEARVADVFSHSGRQQIESLMTAPGRVLLLCDGGDKVREFTTFAPFLKPGDVIGAHDYHPGADMDAGLWAWREISDADVEAVCQQAGLLPYFQEACQKAAWLMRVRKGENPCR